MSILARGNVEYDKYDHEDVMRPRAIASVEQLKVVDDAEVKRVELHLHTNMSSMDGMTPAGERFVKLVNGKEMPHDVYRVSRDAFLSAQRDVEQHHQ